MTTEKKQREMVLEALERGESLTFLDALSRFGCARLGARVWDLKRAGHDIATEMVTVGDGKHVASYRLVFPVVTEPKQLAMEVA